MTANFGLIAYPAQRRTNELASQGSCDRSAERRFPDAGRADKAQDRALAFGSQLSNGEKLEDPLLDLLEVEVVLVEDGACGCNIEIVGAVRCPGQRGHPIEPGPCHRRLGAFGVHGPEPSQLPVHRLPRFLAEAERSRLLSVLRDLQFDVVNLSKLLLDGAQLLAKQEFALVAIDFAPDLR